MGIISKYLRILSTGLSFVVFMVWGFSLGMVVFPVVTLLPGTKRKRREMFMRHMAFSWRTFIRFMELIKAFGKIEIQGLDNFKQNRSCLLIANHPTLVDIVAIGSKVHNFNCIVKMGLWKHPFFGAVVRQCDFIPNVGSQELISLCEDGFKDDRPLVIFPEGTRTQLDTPLKFHRGAAQIAARTGVPIVPVLITCDPPTLMKNVPWYKVPSRAPHLVLRFGAPLNIPKEIQQESTVPLKVRALNSFIEDYFRNALQKGQL